jgi:glutathione S-transferase
MALIVYGAAVSPFVRKVRVVLAEKRLSYELKQINPFRPPPDFLAISPLKLIPVLRDTDLPELNTLPDSSIICDYLEHKYPEPALYPAEPYRRARALWFEEFADFGLAAECVRVLFFERVVKKAMRQPCDESLVGETLAVKLPPLFDYVEREIGSRQFLVGDVFSIADIAIATMIANFEHAGETVDPSRWPRLARYAGSILARPAFKACLDEEKPVVERMLAA